MSLAFTTLTNIIAAVILEAAPIDDNWQLIESEGSCTIFARYEGDYTLSIYAKDIEDVALIVQRPQWESVEDGRDYDVEVYLGDEDPWNVEARASTGLDGDGPGLIMVFPQKETDEGYHFMGEFMAAENIRIEGNDRTILNLSLGGSYNASLAFARCLGRMMGTAADDPFAYIAPKD